MSEQKPACPQCNGQACIGWHQEAAPQPPAQPAGFDRNELMDAVRTLEATPHTKDSAIAYVAAFVRACVQAAPPAPAQPVAWLIVGIVHGMERRTVALHNAIADFRELWGDETTSTPLYAAPPVPAQPVGQANYVPNMLRCAKCNFELERLTLNAHTGAIGIGTNEPEPCPNGCGPLWRVTWEQEAGYLAKRMNEWADRAIAAEKRLAAQPDDAAAIVRQPIAFALRFGEDRRLNLSTVFGTMQEAAKYAESCGSRTQIVPLCEAPEDAAAIMHADAMLRARQGGRNG